MKVFFGKALLILFGIVFPIFLLELLVRLLPPAMLPSPLNTLVEEMDIGARRTFQDDPELGHTIKPNTDLEIKHPDFTFHSRTNLNLPDAGFRGGTLGGPVWGVALGDSFTYGIGVNQEATWVARLSALAKQDVINFGVAAYGPSQYTGTLDRYGLSLSPKIIFYALYTNDLDDCLRFEEWLNGHRQRKTSVTKYLRQNSVTFNLLSKLTGWWKASSRYIEVSGVGVMLIPRKLHNPYNLGKKKFSSAWMLAVRQIEKAYERSKKINAKFVLLYFPSKEEVYWDRVKATARRFSSFEKSRDKLSHSLREFCAEHQLYCLDLSAALRARGSKGEKLYYPIDIHWNENGHRVVAEEIHKFLIDVKIL